MQDKFKHITYSMIGLAAATTVLVFVGSTCYSDFTKPSERVVKEADLNGDGITDRVVEKTDFRLRGPYADNGIVYLENQYGFIIDGKKIFVPQGVIDKFR
ncbi:MAG: hypothetical protein NT129_00460 [Candidatus Aenigmarchaeota archaeon]|nr:hypothetical protein [Candidatus Aenigmarchaeota archaeon]